MDKIYEISRKFGFLIVKVEEYEKVVADKKDFEQFIQLIIEEAKKGKI